MTVISGDEEKETNDLADDAVNKTKRITADFTPEAYQMLDDVARRLHTTKADALRKALGLIDFILREKDDGWKVTLEKPNTRERKEIVTL